MKKLLFFLLPVLCGTASHTFGQTDFPVRDSLTINNIKPTIGVFGDLFTVIHDGFYATTCFFPADSRKIINGYGALWMSGYDAGGQLHVSAQTYRQNGNDYWPGPLDNNDTLSQANSYKWAKIWKVSRADILAFKELPSHDINNTLPVILTWPGKGNIYAKGNEGYALTVDKDMAPFADLNGNGIYEPLNGEYPQIKGDQAAWWVFSDNGPSHAETNGKPMKTEVHAMLYGYKRNTLIDNVIFYEFDIINRSAETYNNARFALWDDIELGYYLDDYIGFDSSHRMGIAYNAYNEDGVTGSREGSYGPNPPITGITLLETPGDNSTMYVPAGCFNTYVNDTSVIGNPANGMQYSNYMRSRMRNGQHISSTFNGPGSPCGMFYTTHTGTPCDYLFPGDPSDPNQWSQCQCNDPISDERFIISSNDFTFPAGATRKFSFAQLVVAGEGGCGTANFAGIKNLADTVWNVYRNPLIAAGIEELAKDGISIYPNPASDRIFIEQASSLPVNGSVCIYDISGRKMNITTEKQGKKYIIDINSFAPGMYHIQYADGDKWHTATFVKN